MNLAAEHVVGHGVHHADKHQIWWFVATGDGNEATLRLVFDTKLGRIVDAGLVRDGWSQHTGDGAACRCSVMFSNTLGATVSRDLKPYIGQSGGNARIWKCDTDDLTDNGTAFRAYVEFPDRHYAGLNRGMQMNNPIVVGVAGSYSLFLQLTDDYGDKTRSGSVSMVATNNAARVARRVESVETANANAVRVLIGDETAASVPQWSIDALVIPYESRAFSETR